MTPSACIPMVLQACHDHAMSGGYLAYKHTFDKATRSTIGERGGGVTNLSPFWEETARK